MASSDQIKAELSELTTQARAILKELIDEKSKANFHFDYQAWYTKALRAVASLAPDRYDEFRRFYEPDPKRKSLGYGTYVIQDYLKGVVPNKLHHPDFKSRQQAAQGMINQLAILASLASRIDSVLANVEAHLLADLQDAELSTARALVAASPRAGGALAGVVLEGYLQKVAVAHQVKMTKKAPTIGDLNDPLKQASVYDTAVWRKIAFLADLRNLCSHRKGVEPSPEQAVELIEGVNWVIKNVR